MQPTERFYIDGEWVTPVGERRLDVVNPATEKPIATVAMGEIEDLNRAVGAARKSFESFCRTTREDRMALLRSIVDVYKRRMKDLSATLTSEMGAPVSLADGAQVPAGLNHFVCALEELKGFAFEEDVGSARVIREPIGVCGLITPWNWPLNQIGAKMAAVIATGCVAVLKPSEVAPLTGLVMAEIMDEAGVPPGVFNVINGEGPTLGVAMSSHPDIDMISFTGSTRAGVSVAENSAATVKRVTQELGGKSPNIILEDADFEQVIPRDFAGMCMNSGQTCNAATRMLVPESRAAEAVAIAKMAAESTKVGDPLDRDTEIGPLVSSAQLDKVRALIERGIQEGAQLVTGGVDTPAGLSSGYYVKPTVFSRVTNDMTIAREEIFGPVLSIITYKDEAEAVRIANDTVYGLAAYVSSADPERAKRVGKQLRAGNVHLNGARVNPEAPFGGYKQSGNGREFSRWGMQDFLEIKALLGFNPSS